MPVDPRIAEILRQRAQQGVTITRTAQVRAQSTPTVPQLDLPTTPADLTPEAALAWMQALSGHLQELRRRLPSVPWPV